MHVRESSAGGGGGNGITIKSPKRCSPPYEDPYSAVRDSNCSQVLHRRAGRTLRALSSGEPCLPSATAKTEMRPGSGFSACVCGRAHTVWRRGYVSKSKDMSSICCFIEAARDVSTNAVLILGSSCELELWRRGERGRSREIDFEKRIHVTGMVAVWA